MNWETPETEAQEGAHRGNLPSRPELRTYVQALTPWSGATAWGPFFQKGKLRQTELHNLSEVTTSTCDTF